MEFDCSACGRRIAAPDGSAGMQVQCPLCRQVVAVPGAAPAAAGAPGATKICPFCAEAIPAAALKCPRCREFLDPTLAGRQGMATAQGGIRWEGNVLVLSHGARLTATTCISCAGSEDVQPTRKKFQWYPPWINLTILIAWPLALILMLVMRKFDEIEMSFCRRCRKRWTMALVVPYGYLLGALFLPLACWAAFLPFMNRHEDSMGAGCGIGFLLWLIGLIPAMIWVRRLRPIPKEITAEFTKLKFPRPEATRQALGGGA